MKIPYLYSFIIEVHIIIIYQYNIKNRYLVYANNITVIIVKSFEILIFLLWKLWKYCF